jgi:hypothetical protein
MQKPDTLTAPDIFPKSRSSFFSPTPHLGGPDFMIRYSTSRSTIRLTNPNARTELVGPVEKQYRELLELREQVEMAEAAAKRLGRVKLKTCARPVARLVSRKPIKRQPCEFTKGELYAMLAEAVRNTN